MAITQTIKLDLNNHKADDIILRVGESYTRKIVFIPGTYDGDEFTPTEFYGREEGPRAMFRMVKPDRTFVMQNLTVVHEEPDTGVYSFELVPDEYMSQVGGIGYYDIRINDSDDESEFLYTLQGRVLIDDDMITDSMIESVAAANGYTFPDDFLTKGEFDPDDYATKQYVDEAIADIPIQVIDYSDNTEHEYGKWVDGTTVYERFIYVNASTYFGNNSVNILYDSSIKQLLYARVDMNTSGSYYHIPDNNTRLIWWNSTKVLSLVTGGSTFTSSNYLITIRYTKN